MAQNGPPLFSDADSRKSNRARLIPTMSIDDSFFTCTPIIHGESQIAFRRSFSFVRLAVIHRSLSKAESSPFMMVMAQRFIPNQ
jgi:hypothetical protein